MKIRFSRTSRVGLRTGAFVLGIVSCLAGGASAQEAFVMDELQAERVVVAPGGYFPRMELLKNGDLLVSVKAGAAHVGKAGRADIVRSTDGGRTWGKPVTVFDLPGRDDAIDAMGRLSDGTLIAGIVSYSWAGERYTGEGWSADTWVIRSSDHGFTWSEPVKLEATPHDWLYPFGRPVELEDGTVLLSGYGSALPRDRKTPTTSFVVRSRDGGKTWGEYVPIASRFDELCIARLPSGKLVAALRETGGSASLSFSSDGGRTWSETRRLTEAAEHPADLLVLADGRLLITFGVRHQPYGVQAMLSRDGGETWSKKKRILLAWDGDHGDLGYPVSIQRPDGRIVTAYYIVYGERDSYGDKGVAMKNSFTKAVIWSPPR